MLTVRRLTYQSHAWGKMFARCPFCSIELEYKVDKYGYYPHSGCSWGFVAIVNDVAIHGVPAYLQSQRRGDVDRI
jgi:hypothetical protein